MRSRLTGVILGAALAIGPSVFAQDTWDLNHREQWLQERVDRGLMDRTLDKREADLARHEIDRIHHEQIDLAADNGGELKLMDRDRLEAQLDQVADQIHWLTQEASIKVPWPRL